MQKTPVSVPRIHVGQLTCNSSSRASHALFWPWRAPALKCACAHITESSILLQRKLIVTENERDPIQPSVHSASPRPQCSMRALSPYLPYTQPQSGFCFGKGSWITVCKNQGSRFFSWADRHTALCTWGHPGSKEYACTFQTPLLKSFLLHSPFLKVWSALP